MPFRTIFLLSFLVAPVQQRPELDPQRSFPRCSWSNETQEELVLRLRSGMDLDGGNGDYTEWSDWIERHASSHGWGEGFEGPDLVARNLGVKCPSSVLEAIEGIRDLSRGVRATALYSDFARILDRNDRVDSALAMLNLAKSESKPSRGEDAKHVVARIHRSAAQLCARRGRWEDALRYAADWIPNSRCANCIPSEEQRIAAFRARCLVATARWEDVRTLVAAQRNRYKGVDESLVESWIEASLASKASPDARAAFDELFGRRKDVPAEEHEVALRHWEILRLPPDERATRLDELCMDSDEHLGEALEYLLAHPALLEERLTAMTVPQIPREDYGWLRILAPLADPRVGAALEREIGRVKGAEEMMLTRARETYLNASTQRR